MSRFQSLKDQLKSWALEIRTLKNTRPQKFRGTTPLWQIEGKINTLKWKFRHHHIAYCELRGRSYEQIERKVGEHNEPNRDQIEKIKAVELKKLQDSLPKVTTNEKEHVACVSA